MGLNLNFGFRRKKDSKEKNLRPRMQRWGIELAKLTGLAAILSPANFLFTNFMLFHPERDTLPDQDRVNSIRARYLADWSDENFTARDGTKLHGWYIKVPHAQKTFLVSHGNAGNLAYRLKIIDALAASGSSVFVYDYRGYGKSEGQPSPEGIADDGIGAYDFLVKEKSVCPDNIVLYGESLGCAVSTIISQNRPVCGIVLQSGFSTVVEAARDKLPFYHLYPDDSFPQRFLDNVTAYKKKHPPLLLVHGERDWVLPCRYSKQIFDSAIEPKQLVLLPNAAHNDVYGIDAAIATSALKTFVQSLISQTVADNKLEGIEIPDAANIAVPAMRQ